MAQGEAEIVRLGDASTGVLLKLRMMLKYLPYLSPLAIADSRDLAIGTEVWSVGNAFNAIEQDGAASFSRGSQRHLRHPRWPANPRPRRHISSATTKVQVIEVSAAVNDGNQGGALTNGRGELLGLVSLGMNRDRKMGTVIPIHLLLEDLGLAKETLPAAAQQRTRWGSLGE